jgi:hypothetical protein
MGLGIVEGGRRWANKTLQPGPILLVSNFLAKVEALLNKTGKRMDNHVTTRRSRIDAALAAQLELLSGAVSGASTYRVHG